MHRIASGRSFQERQKMKRSMHDWIRRILLAGLIAITGALAIYDVIKWSRGTLSWYHIGNLICVSALTLMNFLTFLERFKKKSSPCSHVSLQNTSQKKINPKIRYDDSDFLMGIGAAGMVLAVLFYLLGKYIFHWW
jgi:hypothetical protein